MEECGDTAVLFFFFQTSAIRKRASILFFCDAPAFLLRGQYFQPLYRCAHDNIWASHIRSLSPVEQS